MKAKIMNPPVTQSTNLRLLRNSNIHYNIYGRDSWTVRGSNSGGDEVFRAHPDRPRGPPSLLYPINKKATAIFGGKKIIFFEPIKP